MKKVLNDLFDYSLKIYQSQNGFKFSLDSILLAEFIEIKPDISVIDFCTGNAAIPLVLSTKIQSKIYGLEIQKEIFSLATANILLNELDDKITILNEDVKLVNNAFKAESFDIVSCNPPYFKIDNTKKKNDNVSKLIARHELMITLEEVIKSAKYILKNKGSFYLVHRPERLGEIQSLLKMNNFETKKMQFVYSNIEKNAIIVLLKAVKNGKPGLKVLKPLDVTNMKTFKNMVGE